MDEQERYMMDLAACLAKMPEADRQDALEFYQEYLADAGLKTRSDIEAALGTPRTLSRKSWRTSSSKIISKPQIKQAHDQVGEPFG